MEVWKMSLTQNMRTVKERQTYAAARPGIAGPQARVSDPGLSWTNLEWDILFEV